MLARHSLALLVTLLLAGPARPGEPCLEHLSPACGSVASACPAGSDLWIGGDASCHDVFCPQSFIDRHRCWYVQAETLWLYRTSGRARPLVVAGDSGASVLDISDLNLGFQPGPRVLIGHRTSSDRSWEFSYFGLYEGRARATAEDPNNLDIDGTLLGVAEDFSGADRMTIHYSARLHHAEANLARDRDTWSVLAGLRYLHLNDQTTLTARDSDSGVSDYTARSQTDLIGPQLGFRSGQLCDRCGWELTFKAGLYGSLMHQQQRLLDNDNTFLLRDGSAGTCAAAFLGDFNFLGYLPLNEVWSLRAGYYAMYVAGVALATDQLDFENLATSGQRVSRGEIFLHGVSLGLEANW